MKKRLVPEMTTDEEAEAFLDQDLSDLDRSSRSIGNACPKPPASPCASPKLS